MHKSEPYQNLYSSPLSSPKYGSFLDRFAKSQQLNNKYLPNFKKLSRNKISKQQSQISLIEIFNVNKIQKIITSQCQNQNILCELCEYNYEKQQMLSLCKNQHFFCQNCLIQYVSYKIGAMQELRCPQEICNEKIQLESQIFQKLPEGLKRRYHRAQLWRQTMNNPDLRLCPMQFCDGQVDTRLTPYSCNSCKKELCPECMMEKHLGNCDAIYEAIHKQWRRCPSCRMFIAKIQGCNHIRCRCNHEFCFVCLQKWESSHYSCLQRAQMILFSVEEVKLAILIGIIMVLSFPILIILAAIAIILCFIVMIPVGFVMGLGLTIMKFIHLFCLIIVILPIGGAIGALIFPFYFTFGHVFPHFIHNFRRYKITIQQLFINFPQKSA